MAATLASIKAKIVEILFDVDFCKVCNRQHGVSSHALLGGWMVCKLDGTK